MGTEANLPHLSEQIVWRRLIEPFNLFGHELDGRWWLAILIPVLVLALVYVVIMYRRDARSIGAWSIFLAGLRLGVYAVLTVLFLMPARQLLEESITRFKVLVLFDVSGSMNNKDDLPTDAVPLAKVLSRQDKVLAFLNDEQVAFLKALQKNPTTLYRWGSVIDPETKSLDDELPSPAVLASWLKPEARPKLPPATSEEEQLAQRRLLELHALLVNGTNVPESILSVLKKEGNNQPQGIIVFSDGRNTQFSKQAIAEVRKSKVPVYVVGVGEYRDPISIRITELLVPPQVLPDTAFPVRVEIDGEGMPGQEVPVTLDVYKPEGDKPALTLTELVRFKQGDIPHGQVEFSIDPAKLPPDLLKPEKTSKPEMIDGKWKFIVRVARDKREIFASTEHVSDPEFVMVVKKPLRVLLFAGGPTRDYQFVRTLMVRETDLHRAELSIYLQNSRGEIVQDVPEDRLLKDFPKYYRPLDDASEQPDDKYLNLLRYDVIIAFDPDWTKLSKEALENVEKWVDRGGGLIMVGGPVYTTDLTNPLPERQALLKPIRNLCPVVLENLAIHNVDRLTSEPYRLTFSGATKEMEFLRLNEEASPDANLLSGWEEFFAGKEHAEPGAKPEHGFYDFYPVREVKPSSIVVATFADPRARMKDGREQPYLVMMPYGSGQHNVAWIGSGEMWRLRQYREAFHERFWVKLCRYVSSGSMSGQKARGEIYIPSKSTAHKIVRVLARLDGKDMSPLAATEKPQALINPPPGEAKIPPINLKANLTAEGKSDGWFSGQMQLSGAGNYEMEIVIPGTNEKVTKKFEISQTNPELDNPRPDFVELRQLASDATVLPDDVRKLTIEELERTNRPFQRGEETGLRLYFDLKSAALIPKCMTRKPLPQISRGPITDLWDWGYALFNDPSLKISFAMLLLIGLFSVEWLTRKLLRLA